MNDRIEFAFWTAGSNWLMWRADFEFPGPHERMPVLADQERFSSFITEYRLLQGQTSERREELRQRLLGAFDFREMTKQDDGNGIDTMAHRLSEEFPGLGVQRSFLSKLAAFARPECFIAWDQFAREGVANLTEGPAHGKYATYSDYLAAINTAWEGEHGHRIRKFVDKKRTPTQQPNDAFSRRVFDVYLMIEGGRWSPPLVWAPE